MSRCEIDPNLVLFLDPAGVRSGENWLFFDGLPNDAPQLLKEGKNLVCRFPRRRLLHQFLATALLRLMGVTISRVLFVNDGLLSCFLHARSKKAYRLYARRHLPKMTSMCRCIKHRLPLSLRSEATFLVLTCAKDPGHADSRDRALVEATELMFFSNRLGKLLLLDADSLARKQGEVMKTTAHAGYLPVMEREFATLSEIRAKMTDRRSLPQLGRHFVLNDRHFFTEEYIDGESLRHVLYRHGTRGEPAQACQVLHRLDQWYGSYLGIFNGSPRHFSALTAHLLPLFSACYRGGPPELVEAARRHLAELDRSVPALAPVVSHNDLWPGNVLCTEQGLVVVDWERATRERAPFFDYLWMMVSATLQYLAGASGSRYDSNHLDSFFTADDAVAVEAHRLLRLFLKRLQVPDQQFQAVVFLFLMEGSVQGYQALGRQTEMDGIFLRKLLEFAALEGADATAGRGPAEPGPDQVDDVA